ncbi:uncharacterized protein PFL1_01346 [Pseudozyma flocculosa PF-1]|uniref:uncharacterized protein n=1 Tax=Pseudozyma flocculosa PF-1 TaxID=1277687 RepID=UPI000456131A|nr:uncharacterized protein PFL1_01346 [Pseudozyma flocculosa PF-1]EPQ31158.1 hypothetical protein PFL1_01346 [Pseudozyma flocculosa PF-1]
MLAVYTPPGQVLRRSVAAQSALDRYKAARRRQDDPGLVAIEQAHEKPLALQAADMCAEATASDSVPTQRDPPALGSRMAPGVGGRGSSATSTSGSDPELGCSVNLSRGSTAAGDATDSSTSTASPPPEGSKDVPRRIVKACDQCYKLKRRCFSESDDATSCSRCLRLKKKCTWDQVPSRVARPNARAPPQSTSAQGGGEAGALRYVPPNRRKRGLQASLEAQQKRQAATVTKKRKIQATSLAGADQKASRAAKGDVASKATEGGAFVQAPMATAALTSEELNQRLAETVWTSEGGWSTYRSPCPPPHLSTSLDLSSLPPLPPPPASTTASPYDYSAAAIMPSSQLPPLTSWQDLYGTQVDPPAPSASSVGPGKAGAPWPPTLLPPPPPPPPPPSSSLPPSGPAPPTRSSQAVPTYFNACRSLAAEHGLILLSLPLASHRSRPTSGEGSTVVVDPMTPPPSTTSSTASSSSSPSTPDGDVAGAGAGYLRANGTTLFYPPHLVPPPIRRRADEESLVSALLEALAPAPSSWSRNVITSSGSAEGPSSVTETATATASATATCLPRFDPRSMALRTTLEEDEVDFAGPNRLRGSQPVVDASTCTAVVDNPGVGFKREPHDDVVSLCLSRPLVTAAQTGAGADVDEYDRQIWRSDAIASAMDWL